MWSASAAPAETVPLGVEPTTTTIAPTTTTQQVTTTTSQPASTTTTEPPRGKLVIHGTGDVAVDPTYIPTLARMGYDHAWTGLNGLFLRDDLSIINLECVPSDQGAPLEKAFNFRCPTAALPSLAIAGVDVANMANNHSGDYGKDALLDGRAQLIANGVAPVGVGANYEEAGSPALFDINGWRVAVVGFGGVAPSASWYADVDRPGMRSGDDAEGMAASVAAASELADIVIVTVHWGFELDTAPRQEDIDSALAMIDAGADIIFGHSSHRLADLEIVDGVPVFWQLGNFVWPHNSVASATTAVARVVIDEDGSMVACMIPAYIETHGRPELRAEPVCDAES